VGARFSAPVQTDRGAHPAFCTMGTGSFSGVKSGRGVTVTPHPLLVPWSWKSRAIPPLPLWSVRPVQSLSACTRVHFNCIFSRNPQHLCSRQKLEKQDIPINFEGICQVAQRSLCRLITNPHVAAGLVHCRLILLWHTG